MAFRFEWDGRKAAANMRKHGVSFAEASTVFDDPLALIFDDELHSADEVRELIIGHSYPFKGCNHRLAIKYPRTSFCGRIQP